MLVLIIVSLLLLLSAYVIVIKIDRGYFINIVITSEENMSDDFTIELLIDGELREFSSSRAYIVHHFRMEYNKWYFFEVRTNNYKFVGSNCSLSGKILVHPENKSLTMKLDNANAEDYSISEDKDSNRIDAYSIDTRGEDYSIRIRILLYTWAS